LKATVKKKAREAEEGVEPLHNTKSESEDPMLWRRSLDGVGVEEMRVEGSQEV
jgi:hypothetical protein